MAGGKHLAYWTAHIAKVETIQKATIMPAPMNAPIRLFSSQSLTLRSVLSTRAPCEICRRGDWGMEPRRHPRASLLSTTSGRARCGERRLFDIMPPSPWVWVGGGYRAAIRGRRARSLRDHSAPFHMWTNCSQPPPPSAKTDDYARRSIWRWS